MATVQTPGEDDTAQVAGISESLPKPKSQLDPLNIPVLQGVNNDSDDDHNDDEYDHDDAQSVVGVSISRAQTNLLSPALSTAQKSAAFDPENTWGFFDDKPDDEQEGMIRDSQHKSSTPSTQSSPSLVEETAHKSAGLRPRFSEPTIHIDQHLSEELVATHPDTSEDKVGQKNGSRTGSITPLLGELNIKRFIPRLSLSGRSPLHSPRLSSTDGGVDPNLRVGRSRSIFIGKMAWASNLTLRSASRDASPLRSSTYAHRRIISSPMMPQDLATPQTGVIESEYHTSQIFTPNTYQSIISPGQRLKRHASHDSIPLSALSRGSSIDDYERFAHIDSQVNTRVKAIRDTITDNLPSISTINFSVFKPEFSFSKVNVTLPKAISTKLSSQTRARGNSDAANSSPTKTAFTNPRYPSLEEALQNLTGDIVILGGYRGSTLRSAEPPHRQLWAPIKVGLGMRNVDLEVGLQPEDEETMEQRIFPSGMLTHVGPIDISRRLIARLRKCQNSKQGDLRVHDWGYDWRLSPALLAKKLKAFLETLQCNQPGTPAGQRGATVIAHSLGGLITRKVVNERPDIFAGVVYAGTPQFCVNILGPFRNGDDVLLSSRILTAQVNFTLRTSFALLPESGHCFIDIDDPQTKYHVDFFNVDSWKKYAFSPCISRTLPSISLPEPRRSIFGSLSLNTPTSARSSTPDLAEKLESKAKTLSNPTENTLDLSMGPPPSAATASSLPIADALSYLDRTLRETLAFKKSLHHNEVHQRNNAYPPMSVLYSTSLPTVYGAKVSGRDGIARADAYDNLAFASGDGVVLARAAMLPRGYKCAPHGRVRTDRGHVSMLSDLDAIGKCLCAVIRARASGVGLGIDSPPESAMHEAISPRNMDGIAKDTANGLST